MAAQRTPTERQYKYLRPIAGGAAWIVASKRDCEPLIRHGWVTAEQKQDDRGFYYAFARITPDGLRALALAVEKYGYDVVLIDSLSHEWKWCLDEVDNVIARTNNRNSYAAWREITPRHNALTEAILASGCHVIGTMRTKMDYILEEDEKGKKAPRKVGMAPVQRDGIEYEFDLIGDLDIDNKMVVSKTRCPALAGAVIRKPGVELAETLKGWLGTGTEPAPPAPVPAAAEETHEAGGGGDEPERTEEYVRATKGMWATIGELVDAGGVADDIKTALYAFYGVTSTKQLTLGEVKQATADLKRQLAERKKAA